MSFFEAVSDEAPMLDALKINAAAGRLLIQYHTVVMRGPSPLAEAERELIAAFVSALNACRYCYGVHGATAKAFGIDQSLLDELIEDPAAKAAPERLRPLLKLARKLTLDQAKITRADITAALEAGWEERAVHDAICVTALFNFMNRFVHGHGMDVADSVLIERGERLMRSGYEPLRAALDDELAAALAEEAGLEP